MPTYFYSTRLHSSRMHTARSLTVSPSMHCAGGSASGGCLLPEGGCLLQGVVSQHALKQTYRPSCGQNSWHTPMKILPCPKLRLRAVTRRIRLSSSELSCSPEILGRFVSFILLHNSESFVNFSLLTYFFKNVLEDLSNFWRTNSLMSALGFEARVDSFAFVLCRQRAMDFSAWQPYLFDPHTWTRDLRVRHSARSKRTLNRYFQPY